MIKRFSVITPKPYTARRLVEEVERSFAAHDLHYGHGTDNPRDEAVYLVFCALGIAFDCPEQDLDAEVGREAAARVFDLARKRVEDRTPIAYLVNQAWFCGLPFHVDERVLIPRSPLAESIENRFAPWLDADRVSSILDIGTGSACIAVACALAFPEARVDAVDISAEALVVAHGNVERHGLAERIRLIKSDLYENLGDRKYDLIVANPPYVTAREMRELPPEHRHEPALALAAGSDGLDVVRRLLAESGRHLRPDGILVVEVGNGRESVDKTFPSLPFVWLDFEYGGEGVFLLEARSLKMS